MSLIDYKCPTSFGFEFCSASKTVDSKWTLLTANITNPLNIKFVQQVKSWLKMSIIDYRFHTFFGFEFCSADQTIDCKCPTSSQFLFCSADNTLLQGLTWFSVTQTGCRWLISYIEQKKFLACEPEFSVELSAPPEFSGGVMEMCLSTG